MKTPLVEILEDAYFQSLIDAVDSGLGEGRIDVDYPEPDLDQLYLAWLRQGGEDSPEARRTWGAW